MAQDRPALLREARHVENHAGLAFDVRGHAEQRSNRKHASAADAADGDVVGPLQGRQRHGLRQIADIGKIGWSTAAKLAAIDRYEGRAEALHTGIILVARRLIDRALTPEFGLQRLDRYAVR